LRKSARRAQALDKKGESLKLLAVESRKDYKQNTVEMI